MRYLELRTFATLAAAAGAAAILAGCAASGGPDSGRTGSSGSSGAAGARDPLLDAPYHSEVTCTTERPVTVLSRIKETPFACSDLGVSATLDDLRDAGWRVVSLDIGAESERHVGFPVTVLIRKLY